MPIESVIQDLRLALRQLTRRRAFAAIVLATLALGIGATSTFFSVLNGVALRPLPFQAPDELIAISRVAQSGALLSRMSGAQVATVQDGAPALASVVAHVSGPVTLSGEGGAEQVIGAEMSADLFALLGVPLQRGRSLQAGDPAPVAVISHELWTRRFASDSGAVGATIRIDGTPHIIVGIAPAGFAFPSDARIWYPLARNASERRVEVVARLSSGVSAAQADALLRTMPAPLSTDTPDRAAWIFGAVPLRDAVAGSKQRDVALVLVAASGLVLVVACANLAGLLLAYVSGRRHELAVRAAIGAGRGRLIRQLMTESLVLALIGGGLGVILAQWGLDLFIGTLGKPGGAAWLSFSIDGRVLLFALATSMATAVLFGMAPAIGGSRVDIRGVLQEDRSSSQSPRRRRMRGGLVAAQVALSLGLVAGAASVVMSSLRMADIHPGFDRDGLLVLRAPLPGARYDAAAQRMAFVNAARDRLRGIPGISGVSAVSHPPLVERNVPATAFMAEGWAQGEPLPFASFRFVDGDYVDMMRIPIRRGRAFTSAEARDASGAVVLINETMARRHWPGRDAVGGRLRLPGAAHPDVWFTVIGVVGDVAQRMLPAQPENQMYFALPMGRDVSLVVRATSDPAVAGAAARDAVRAVDSSVAVALHSMDGTYRAYMRDRRLQGFVLGALGLVAVLVAALGVYGVMSLTVTERRREIAIRAALGGTRAAIVRLVLGNAMRVTSAGIAAGLLLAVGVTSFLSSIFFGLRAFDPRVFAAAAGLLGCVALISSWWPARAAARVDPMAALKT